MPGTTLPLAANRRSAIRYRPRLIPWLALLVVTALNATALPPGFTEVNLPRPDGQAFWNEAVGIAFSESGRMFVWERGGKVWIVDEHAPVPQPILDLSDEVLAWRDHGMLGFALDPNFDQTGRLYAMFVVDPYHLFNCDSPRLGVPQCVANYSPTVTWVPGDPQSPGYKKATIGRIVSYQAIRPAGDSDYHHASQVDYTSRKVLIGDTARTQPKSTGFPVLFESHAAGTLLFGDDGTLLASFGDGASYNFHDVGSIAETYFESALADGVIKPKENVGALRAQLVDSLSGKIVRIDPNTGDGIPSNPYYDGLAPREPRSRVWARGLRNPFRMTLRPDSGSHAPADGNPGVLFVGDVGFATWEDVNVVTSGGRNFGWPLYEGLDRHDGYYSAATNVYNLDAPNPLFGQPGCTLQYFRFVDLLEQDTLNTPAFLNPCSSFQPIPASAHPSLHARPIVDYLHHAPNTRWAAYAADGRALALPLGTAAPDGTTVTGAPFTGSASTGGVWFQGTGFPSQYSNVYFHGDYSGQWIKAFVFAANNRLQSIEPFASGAGGVVTLGTHPSHDGLYYIAWTAFVRKVTYAPAGGRPPVAVASATPSYGQSPLTVTFSSNGSSDPDGGPITYLWDFGDSGSSTAANPQHTYTTGQSTPLNFTATLTVRDAQGLVNQRSLLISANNTPPSAEITSPIDNGKYSMTGPTVVSLQAAVGDAQTPPAQLTCQWQEVLYHNQHEHTSPFINSCSASAAITPIGCNGQSYSYGFRLWVFDAQGLSGTDEVRLFPDCPADTTPPSVPSGVVATPVSASQIAVNWTASTDAGTGVGGYRVFRNGTLVGSPTATTFTDTGLAANTQYSYTVTAVDNGIPPNQSATSAAATATTLPAQPDTTPPSVPTGVQATPLSTSQIAVNWTASTDAGTGVAGYRVFRDGTLVGSPTATTYTDTGLAANTMYRYTVTAIDRATPPNQSAASVTASATTFAVPTGLAIRVNTAGPAYTDSLGQAWAADSGFNTGNASTVGNAIANTVDDVLYQSERWDDAAAPELQYSFAVPNGTYLVRLHFAENFSGAFAVGARVFDVDVEGVRRFEDIDVFAAVGARAALVRSATVDVADGQINILFRHQTENPMVYAIEIIGQGGTVDTTPPTVPGGVVATPTSGSQITVTWTASTDAGTGVAGYRVFRDGTLVGSPTATTFSDAGLAANTLYRYTVTAVDGAVPPNQSGVSTTATATTLGPPPDTTPPSVPTGVLATPLSTSQIAVNWTASTDAGTGVAGYRVFRNGTLVGSPTATTFNDTGLTASTQYSYTVTAVDNATPANQSALSVAASATTFGVPTGFSLRINTAGPAYTDSLGQAWAADSGFNTGVVNTVGDAIANTVDDVLYQSNRWDDAAAPELQYSLTVPNGSYLVRLHFAENFSGAFAVGARVFDVDIEGVRRFEDIDVFAAAGARAALVRSTDRRRRRRSDQHPVPPPEREPDDPMPSRSSARAVVPPTPRRRACRAAS